MPPQGPNLLGAQWTMAMQHAFLMQHNIILSGLPAEGVQIDRHHTSLLMLLHQGLWYADLKGAP